MASSRMVLMRAVFVRAVLVRAVLAEPPAAPPKYPQWPSTGSAAACSVSAGHDRRHPGMRLMIVLVIMGMLVVVSWSS